MLIAVVKEAAPQEQRVALVPAEIARLSRRHLQIGIEAGAGIASGHADAAYESKGAKLFASRRELLDAADIILHVRNIGAPGADWSALRPKQLVIGFIDPFAPTSPIEQLAHSGATVLAMELMPRITRAQSMDALSSMANIAGYKAALLAACALPKMFPMMMTAAGTMSPAKVFVLGAGVAGLQAIATARRLGAVVEAYDVRPEVKEQVQSVGGKFVQLALQTDGASDRGGYAKAQSAEFYKNQQAQLATYVRAADAIITTAAIPGRRAPILVTTEMLRGARLGTVLVDLAAEGGGNCELTQPGRTVEWEGISVVGPINIPSSVPFHASQMYARNLTTFVEHLVTPEGTLKLDLTDEIIRETCVTHDGALIHPRVVQLRTHAA